MPTAVLTKLPVHRRRRSMRGGVSAAPKMNYADGKKVALDSPIREMSASRATSPSRGAAAAAAAATDREVVAVVLAE